MFQRLLPIKNREDYLQWVSINQYGLIQPVDDRISGRNGANATIGEPIFPKISCDGGLLNAEERCQRIELLGCCFSLCDSLVGTNGVKMRMS